MSQHRTDEQAQEIAEKAMERLSPLGLDGLVLYDIDDESERNPQERPFPFLPTIDPATYLAQHLQGWGHRRRVSRSGQVPGGRSDRVVAGPGRREVTHRVRRRATRHRPAATTLVRAQELWAQTRPDVRLGGVAIPERHTRRGEEHLRLIAKQDAGCSFFITQVVYDVNAAKNLVSDYRYECEARGLEPVPIIFTFSVCGSLKTLSFLEWLGVDVPR